MLLQPQNEQPSKGELFVRPYLIIHPMEWVACVSILILSVLLRFGWSGVNSFAFDEARLSLISLNMARGGQFATLGMPSSVGVPNLPAAAWIYASPYLFSADPLVATNFTGLLSLGAVAGVWLLARISWGPWAALIAGLFMAASPYSVLYSRSIWAQDLLPVLALVWGWAAYLGIIQKNRVAVAVNVFLAGFIVQVHFAGIGLALGTLYLFLRYRWWQQMVSVLIGSGLVILAALPFIVQVICCAPQVIDEYRGALGGSAQTDLTSFTELLRLALGVNWDYLVLGDLHTSSDLLPALGTGLLLITGLISLFKTVIVNTQTSISRRILAELTFIWLVASPLFFIRHSTPVFIHYQLASLPALALMAAASTQMIRWRFWPLLVSAIMVLIAGIWSVQIGQSLQIAGQVETPFGLGTPLGLTRHAAYSLPDHQPVLFFGHGDDSNTDGEAAVFETLWWEREYRIIQGESLLILPPYPAYLMATLAPFQAWEEIEAAGLASDVQTFPRREGALPFMAVAYDGSTAPAGFQPMDAIMFSDGLQLEGWKARMVGPRLRISTLWRVVEPPPAGIYQQFHHLRTDEALEGEPLMVSDVPISAHAWQVGDLLIVMGDFFIENTDEYWVDVGHYTLPDVTRISHANGDYVQLGPFTLP